MNRLRSRPTWYPIGRTVLRRFHDLRHPFGSLAIRRLDSVTVQAMMGHSRLATTERYLHAKPRADDAARLSSAFAAAPGAATPIEGGADVAASARPWA